MVEKKLVEGHPEIGPPELRNFMQFCDLELRLLPHIFRDQHWRDEFEVFTFFADGRYNFFLAGVESDDA